MVGTSDDGRAGPGRNDVGEHGWAVGRDEPGRGELAALRRDALDRLDLDAGETVLDVQCGRGPNLDPLQSAVGPDGRVVGVEFFADPVGAARALVDERDWDTVDVVRADVTAPPTRPGAFDAAVATAAFEVVPDVRAAVEGVYRALRPGGRLAVAGVDRSAVDPNHPVVGLVERLLGLVADTGDESEVVGAVRDVFDDVDVVPSPADRPGYAVVARKGE